MKLPRSMIERFVLDFVTYHLAALRGQGGGNETGGNTSPQTGLSIPQKNREQLWTTSFHADPWFMDSLELITLAGMMAESFHIHRVGIEDMLLAKPSLKDWSELVETSLQHYNRELTFFTSGSTGRPKAVTHRTRLLEEEVDHLAETVTKSLSKAGQGPPREILSTVASNHIYGFLFTILLPLTLDIPVRPLSGLSLNLDAGQILVTIPNLIRSWHTRSPLAPKQGMVLTSTAPLDRDLAQWLDSGPIPWMEVYGSSETSGIAYRQRAEDSFTLLPYWTPSPDGQSLSRQGLEEPADLPDLVEWDTRTTLRPLERRDQAVQVSGINVFPREIARQLETNPLVSAARVRPMETPGGTRLKAFIVPADPAAPTQETEQRLRSWAASRLPGTSRPAKYSFGPRIPANAMGKEQDW